MMAETATGVTEPISYKRCAGRRRHYPKFQRRPDMTDIQGWKPVAQDDGDDDEDGDDGDEDEDE